MSGRYQERGEKALRRTLTAIATGLVLGAVTWLLTLRIGVFALALPIVGIALLHRSGVAAGAGLLISIGLGSLWATTAAVERCAEFNRRPNAGCQTYGTDEQLILAGAIAALGLLLAGFALVRKRRAGRGVTA